MHKPQFVIRSRAIIVLGDEMLVVKHAPEYDYYALPGGGMEYGENPEICIKREIKEELGVDITNAELKYVYSWDNDAGQNVEFIFLIHAGDEFDNFIDKERTHAFELAEMRWIRASDDIKMFPVQAQEDFRGEGFGFHAVKFIKG